MRLETNAVPATGDPQTAVEEPAVAVPAAVSGTRRFLSRGLLFILIGLLLYTGIYAASDQLVFQYAKRNRFYAVRTAPSSRYDYVILGASHAAVFDFEDMNARLETMTGSRIVNLSVVGGGITVNRLLLEYFLARHQATSVVYFLDSFAFYSREWNEDRLNDTRLFDRAPFDPVLARVLLENPATRAVALNYTLGFSKINNPDRFKPDLSEDEAVRFNTTYRPVKQIDTQRVKYLYPAQIDENLFRSYLTEFEDLVRSLNARNVRLIVIKPPIPERVYRMLPDEARFDEALKAILARHSVDFFDFSLVGNDERLFYNTDHLNRTGVLSFFENSLKTVLAR